MSDTRTEKNTAGVQQASGASLGGNKPTVEEPAKPTAEAVREAANAKIISMSGMFDAEWYAATYPDVSESGLAPALHYIRIGGAEGRAPSSAFDAADYVSRYQDVARTGMNPLLHYVMFGQHESRIVNAFDPARATRQKPRKAAVVAGDAPAPARKQFAAKQPKTPAPEDRGLAREAEHLKLITGSSLFDAEWYEQRYMADAGTGLGPALHFLRLGGAAGNAPSPSFHAADYLARYKDVREAGINPLVHYLKFGKAEKRVAKPFDADAILEAAVLKSGFFDEQWYLATYPEVARSKLSPLRHFLKHGREKNHSPGPGFDTAAYVAAYPDVAAAKINPLVHYLKSGKNEGRAIQEVGEPPKRTPPKPKKQAVATEMPPPVLAPAPPPAPPPLPASTSVEISAADTALIESSQLFDKAWYLARNPDAARLPMSAAEHYLRHGEMRQPSIFFDPQYYVVEQSPEIQHTGINPLLHFLRTGKALGRKPRALFEDAAPPGIVKPVSPSDWPLVSPASSARPAFAWASHADLTQIQNTSSLFIGSMLVAFAPEATVLAASQSTLAVFMEMSGLSQKHGLRQGQGGTRFEARYDAHGYRGLGKALTSGPSAIADCWFTADRTLRIRFGDAAEASHRPLVVRAFQASGEKSPAPVLAGEALVGSGGPAFVDVTLASPFLPLLVVVSETAGETVEIGLLPFPSLCRGGHHHAELIGTAALSDPLAQLRRLSDAYVRSHMAAKATGSRLLSSISVAVTHASGAETIFSAELLSWIASVFGIQVAPAPAQQPQGPGEAFLRTSLGSDQPLPSDTPATAGPGQFTLDLPPDAIPTIAALTARVADARPGDVITGSWLVAEALTNRPLFSVAMPKAAEDLLRLQPAWAVQGIPVLRRVARQMSQPQVHSGKDLHLAIRHAGPREATRASMLMPLAPDSSGSIIPPASPATPVDVILRATSLESSETFLKSLLRQANAPLGHIRIECQVGGIDLHAIQSLVDRLVPGKATVASLSGHRALGPSSLVAGSTSAFMLIADDAVVLHDPRTLEALATLAAADKTASASCVILREAPARKGTALSFESGGFFPSHVSLMSSPRLMLSLPDCRGALPDMTYPVIANDPALVMINTEIMRAIEAPVEDAEDAEVPSSVAFSLQALAQGYRHLCTSAVRATAIGMPAQQNISDPPGLSCIGANTWEQVLGAVTILREIH